MDSSPWTTFFQQSADRIRQDGTLGQEVAAFLEAIGGLALDPAGLDQGDYERAIDRLRVNVVALSVRGLAVAFGLLQQAAQELDAQGKRPAGDAVRTLLGLLRSEIDARGIDFDTPL